MSTGTAARPSRLDDRKVLELIGEIYEAALDPATWPSTLAHLQQVVRGAAPAQAESGLREGGVSFEGLEKVAPGSAGATPHLRELLSHLRRGVQVHQRLSRLQSERDAALDVLDRLPLGVILLDGKGRPVVYNRSAEDILARADTLTLNSGGLTATTSDQTMAMRKLIHDAVSAGIAGKDGAGGVMALPNASGLRPLALLIAPLCELDRAREQDELAAVLFVSDPEELFEAAQETLERLYGLTRAEARLTVLLSQGKPLAKAAEALGIGTGTARAHLKHVFGKTGTRRQAELVRLVLTGPAQLRQH